MVCGITVPCKSIDWKRDSDISSTTGAIWGGKTHMSRTSNLSHANRTATGPRHWRKLEALFMKYASSEAGCSGTGGTATWRHRDRLGKRWLTFTVTFIFAGDLSLCIYYIYKVSCKIRRSSSWFIFRVNENDPTTSLFRYAVGFSLAPWFSTG